MAASTAGFILSVPVLLVSQLPRSSPCPAPLSLQPLIPESCKPICFLSTKQPGCPSPNCLCISVEKPFKDAEKLGGVEPQS